jgi:hypothetical protein
MNRFDAPVATCTKCRAEIVYAELDRLSIAMCANCGEPVELVRVIEDSTDRGFDATVYYDA